MWSGNLNFLEPSGYLGPFMGLIYLFILYFSFNIINVDSIGSKEDELRGRKKKLSIEELNLLAPEIFFLILAHSVYKMWITQEPNTL